MPPASGVLQKSPGADPPPHVPWGHPAISRAVPGATFVQVFQKMTLERCAPVFLWSMRDHLFSLPTSEKGAAPWSKASSAPARLFSVPPTPFLVFATYSIPSSSGLNYFSSEHIINLANFPLPLAPLEADIWVPKERVCETSCWQERRTLDPHGALGVLSGSCCGVADRVVSESAATEV